MLRVIQISVLTLFLFCVGLTTLHTPLEDFTDIDNKILNSNSCDDRLIKSINHRLQQQSLATEILISKLQRGFYEEISDLKISIIKELQNHHNYTVSTTNCEDATNNKLPATCAEAVRAKGRSGIHKIELKPRSKSEIKQPFFVYCEKDTTKDGDAWTIVQRRESNSIDFYRNWTDYKNGFGNLNGNFFIGLDKLHALTQSSMHELWVQLGDYENATRFAKYETFAIGNEAEAYALNILGKYSGDAGDALESHQGYKFSTADVDNDVYPGNCAKKFLGAWWYHKCHTSNLNGLHLGDEYQSEKYSQGIHWSTWRGHYYSLKYVQMAIRSVQ